MKGQKDAFANAFGPDADDTRAFQQRRDRRKERFRQLRDERLHIIHVAAEIEIAGEGDESSATALVALAIANLAATLAEVLNP